MALQLASCLRLPTAGMTSVSYRACLKTKCSPSSQDPMQCVLVKACSPNLFFLLSHTALLWVPGTCCSFRWGHPSCRSPKALTHPARLLLPPWQFLGVCLSAAPTLAYSFPPSHHTQRLELWVDARPCLLWTRLHTVGAGETMWNEAGILVGPASLLAAG